MKLLLAGVRQSATNVIVRPRQDPRVSLVPVLDEKRSRRRSLWTPCTEDLAALLRDSSPACAGCRAGCRRRWRRTRRARDWRSPSRCWSRCSRRWRRSRRCPCRRSGRRPSGSRGCRSRRGSSCCVAVDRAAYVVSMRASRVGYFRLGCRRSRWSARPSTAGCRR